MNVPVLECVDVAVRYGARRPPVVDGVSLAVSAGRTLGIVGESGCGKSTLARAIMGIVPLASGAMRFCGVDITTMGARQRLRSGVACQLVFQDPQSSLDPRMRVRDLIVEPLVIASGPVAGVAERLVEQVGLPVDALTRRPHEFSGGQRQRIAIARALACGPKLLVLDEPTSALDVSVQAQILNLLLDLQHEYRLAYLFISHDLAVIRHMSDEVAVMQGGRIVEHGASVATLDAPRHDYTRTLVHSSLSGRAMHDV